MQPYKKKEALEATEQNYYKQQREAIDKQQAKQQVKQYLQGKKPIDEMKNLPTSWSGKLYDEVLKEITDTRSPEQVAVDKVFEDL